MRRLDTGLFLSGLGLYKARAARGQVLEHDGIERNISMPLALSVVVPVKDEEENVAPLAHEIAKAIADEGGCRNHLRG